MALLRMVTELWVLTVTLYGAIKVGSKEDNSSYHLNMITAEYKYNRELNS
jgi:hypothetical protein